MKQLRVSEDFILEAHKEACSTWKSKIEKEFPSLFESKFTGWQICEYNNYLGHFTENKLDYFIDGIGVFCYPETDYVLNNCNVDRPATKEEVETALIAEAKKRGYRNGNYKCLRHNAETMKVDEGSFFFDDKTNTLHHGIKNDFYNDIFYNGKWAEIIEQKEMTVEQIEKELGYNIKIVK